MPTPMLNVANMSSSEAPDASWRRPKIGCSGQVPRWIVAPSPSGRTRGRFSRHTAAGDVGGCVDQAVARERDHLRRVDRARLEELVRERSVEAGRSVAEVESREERGAHQRVAVRVQAAWTRGRRGHRPRSTWCGPRSADSSTTPTQNPARSKESSAITPGCSAVSPPRSAHPARRQPSATPSTIEATRVGLDPAHGQVIEEEQRLRAGARHVVGTHRDEVDPDGVQPTGLPRDLELRPHAVGRRREEPALADPDRARRIRPPDRATSGRRALAARSAISATALAAASVSTPASR